MSMPSAETLRRSRRLSRGLSQRGQSKAKGNNPNKARPCCQPPADIRAMAATAATKGSSNTATRARAPGAGAAKGASALRNSCTRLLRCQMPPGRNLRRLVSR